MPDQEEIASPHKPYLQRGAFPDIEEEIVAHPDVYLDPDTAYRSMAISRWNSIQAEGGLVGAERARATGMQTRRDRMDAGQEDVPLVE